MRRALVLPLALAVTLLAGCGTGFKLPTESRVAVVPGNGSYGLQAIYAAPAGAPWVGLNDILLTKSQIESNAQLFMLFKTTPSGPGKVIAHATNSSSVFSYHYDNMMNPWALCGSLTRLFVLDQGDTAMARAFRPSSGRNDSNVVNLQYYWRVREYFPDGGDTVSTFTDTTMAWVQGIAVDTQQRIYVGGLYILVTVNPDNPFYRYRRFVWRIHRYLRGAGDPNMPGSSWHRDTNFEIEEGSGLGTVSNPNGLDWSSADGGALFVADTGNNRGQRLGDPASVSDYLMLDSDAGSLVSPVDVSSDLAGFSYVVNGGTAGVFRYRGLGSGLSEMVQRVDIYSDTTSSNRLQLPIAAAADSSRVFVADGTLQQVFVFERRQ
jgi:hypothetical protein